MGGACLPGWGGGGIGGQLKADNVGHEYMFQQEVGH